MDIADGGRDGIDLTGLEPLRVTLLQHGGNSVGGVSGRNFGAPQHADQAPYGMIVDRSLLTLIPDEAHDGKSFQRVAVEQILLIVQRTLPCESLRKPVIDAYQICKQSLADLEIFFFAVLQFIGQAREVGDEITQSRGAHQDSAPVPALCGTFDWATVQ